MAVNTLAIRLGHSSGDLEWVRLDPAGRQLGETASDVEALQDLARDHRVIVLVPALHVIVTEVDVPPTKSAARTRQMIPFALEDTLAQDVDELFFAVGSRRDTGKIAVAVVAKERIEGWLADLQVLGINPTAIYAETEGVPDIPGTIMLIAEGRRLLGRMSGAAPFVFEGADLRQAIDLLGAAREDTGHVLLYADAEAYAVHEPTFAAIREYALTFEPRLIEGTALPRLAATLMTEPGTNLLQGPYAPKSNWVEAARPWRLVAGLLLICALLGTATQGATYFNLQRQERDLAQHIERICRENFSRSQLADCRGEAARRLAAAGQVSAGAERGFLGTLEAVAQHRDPSSAITALSFRNGAMDLRFVAPSVPALDEFVQHLADSGLEARIQSVNPGEQGVESQLQIAGRRP